MADDSDPTTAAGPGGGPASGPASGPGGGPACASGGGPGSGSGGGRWTRRRVLSSATCLLCGTALVPACRDEQAESRLAQLRAAGVARVAVAGEEPFGFVDAGGQLAGAMPAIAGRVLSALGVGQLEPVTSSFNKLIDTLLSGRADIIAAGMSVTADRCRRVAFARPDFRLPQALAVPSGNPLNLTDYRSAAVNPRARIGVLDGAVEAGYALAAGIPPERLLRFGGQAELVTALVSGDIAAFGLTSLSVRMLVSRARAGALEVTSSFVPVVDGVQRLERGAMALNPDHRDLITAYETAATDLRRTGELASILREWGFQADEVTGADEPVACPD